MALISSGKFRTAIQSSWTLVTNANLSGFAAGSIYKGASKSACVPGLNCYSCPGALYACPIGSMQVLSNNIVYNISFYVFGFLIAIGAVCGRFICAWLCPFGLVQDLLYKIPLPRQKLVKGPYLSPIDKYLRYLKYIVLALFVIILPTFLSNFAGAGDPWFCKYICPSGTLFAGLPLIAANKAIRSAVGWLFVWKAFLLLLIIISSVVIYRPFCKYLCPLGAIYGLLNPVSFLRLSVDKEICTGCSTCKDTCKMGVDPSISPGSPECIRCGKCSGQCPAEALSFTMRGPSYYSRGCKP